MFFFHNNRSLTIPTFPVGSKIITEGDSQTRQANTATSTKVANKGGGILPWSLMKNPGWQHRIYYDAASSSGFYGANLAIDGSTWGTMLARIDPTLNSDADVVFVFPGTNTGADESAASTKISRATDWINQVKASGKHVILGTPFPRNTHTGTNAISAALMAEIITYVDWVLSLNRADVTVIDFFYPFLDPAYTPSDDEYGTPLSWVTRDGIHITPRAAHQASGYLDDILVQMMPNNLYSDTWFNNNPKGAGSDNIQTNGNLSGSTGIANNGVTGTVPSTFVSGFTATPSYASGVASLITYDAPWQHQKIVLSCDGLGSATGIETFQFVPLGYSIVESDLTDGDWVQLFVKVRVENNTDGILGTLRAELRNTTTNVFNHGMENTSTTRQDQPWPTGDFEGWIVTEALQWNDNGAGADDVLAAYLYAEILENVAGTADLYIESFIIQPVEAPHITFPYTT